ncbi:GntR family transcriptional regulator [Oceanicella sp. SM1341]|uniref:GntR family transcriptional regulator n=1 Tax=Oceanicella sp. SM1341 TaxID=1548889 RepID=UPI000E4F9E66|nr:GntR family transcriptional regulator [Oceanicella sp. SM1341]
MLKDLRINASPTLRERVADILRGAVANGELAPGERLVERVLCDRMGVSRTSLREALRELENEGLVTCLPNRGLIVSKMDPALAKNIFDLRAALEVLVGRLFCENATDAEIAALDEAFAEVRAAYEQGGRDAIEAKTRFYAVLMAGARNPEAERMLRSIHIRASQLRLLSLSKPERRAVSLEELEGLVAALKRRDVPAVETLCRQHIEAAARAAMAGI